MQTRQPCGRSIPYPGYSRWLLLFFLFPVFPRAAAQTQRIVKLAAPGISKDTLYKRARHELDFIRFSARDTVADIGAYDGYYPALYSVFTDSVVFYLSDLDAEPFAAFDSIRGLCESIGGKKFSNQFYFTIGSDTSTGLEAGRFSKVIVRDAFHHFSQPEKMLRNLSQLLRPGGKLFLFEPLLPDRGVNNSLCAGAMNRHALEALLLRFGFTLVHAVKGKNDHWWMEFALTG